ncbi:hypothetical protein [Bradyrhizobium sp. G127]|uniref:hypothetical protein n=1 Tax=Bradyrhizobium sp. G127 TaxID=2904800 RepID=UPI001F44EC5B|nr:hypothetical protein [Bradyrhizobium sp. G127]MCF2522339.1 hypothetical protein [Bradyrhizobium sp. G127]
MSAAQTSTGSWVYVRSEASLWTVGFYDPDGHWQPESDHPTANDADRRVHYLNGGTNADLVKALEEIRDMPCSHVNDSESLRHTIKTLRYIATNAIAATKTGGA